MEKPIKNATPGVSQGGVLVLPVGAELLPFDQEKDWEFETPTVRGDLNGDLSEKLTSILRQWFELSPLDKQRFRGIVDG